jgi:hypothetical protein
VTGAAEAAGSGGGTDAEPPAAGAGFGATGGCALGGATVRTLARCTRFTAKRGGADVAMGCQAWNCCTPHWCTNSTATTHASSASRRGQRPAPIKWLLRPGSNTVPPAPCSESAA